MVHEFVTTVKEDPAIRLRLREELKRLGVSIETTAELSGIPKGTLDNITAGRVSSMKDVHLSALARALPDLNLRYVLTGELPESPASSEVYRAALQSIKKAAEEVLNKG